MTVVIWTSSATWFRSGQRLTYVGVLSQWFAMDLAKRRGASLICLDHPSERDLLNALHGPLR